MRRIRGQSASELSLVISVVALAVVAASTTMIPLFEDGVTNLGDDVRQILSMGSVGGVGGGRGDNTNASPPSGASPGDVNNAIDEMGDGIVNTTDEIGEDRGQDVIRALGPPGNQDV